MIAERFIAHQRIYRINTEMHSSRLRTEKKNVKEKCNHLQFVSIFIECFHFKIEALTLVIRSTRNQSEEKQDGKETRRKKQKERK